MPDRLKTQHNLERLSRGDYFRLFGRQCAFLLILWNNGIAFSGVMSFVSANLFVPDITNTYRRYYCWRTAMPLFVAIFLMAATVGVIIHYLWGFIGSLP